MPMKKILLSVCLIMVAIAPLMAQVQEQDDIFTIYLVRHAERDDEGARVRDPGLSEAGIRRSQNLATIFKETDINRIYSTNYRRTRLTAAPVAESKMIEPEVYDAGELNKFCALLLSRKEDALVVGHSNTTSVLAGLLAGKDIPPMSESVYDRLYVVVICGESVKIHLLNQGFVQEESPGEKSSGSH